MIKLEKTEVMNLENAIRGARNPLNSHHKSDSHYMNCGGTPNYDHYILGKNDLDLAKRLCKAGHDHRKFLRQIFVSVDITAPLYWWKEQSTYKVGTCENSESTMHTIHKKEFEISDFSFDKVEQGNTIGFYIKDTIELLNSLRKLFLETNDKQYWYSMIQLLPSSYNQTRTCTMTYENLFNMVNSREHHKLDEWKEFVKWALELPYLSEFMGRDKVGDK